MCVRILILRLRLTLNPEYEQKLSNVIDFESHPHGLDECLVLILHTNAIISDALIKLRCLTQTYCTLNRKINLFIKRSCVYVPNNKTETKIIVAAEVFGI